MDTTKKYIEEMKAVMSKGRIDTGEKDRRGNVLHQFDWVIVVHPDAQTEQVKKITGQIFWSVSQQSWGIGSEFVDGLMGLEPEWVVRVTDEEGENLAKALREHLSEGHFQF